MTNGAYRNRSRHLKDTPFDPLGKTRWTARERHESLNKALDLMIQDALDGEAVIEAHNRKHPELPWENVKQDLIQICGDCTKERAARDAQLREEAARLSR